MKIRFRVQKATSVFVIVHELCYRSCWFEVEPLPDDYFYITVKEEQMPFVRSLCESLPKGCFKTMMDAPEKEVKPFPPFQIRTKTHAWEPSVTSILREPESLPGSIVRK